MILKIYDLNGMNKYYANGFEFDISEKRRLFRDKKYIVTMYCMGRLFSTSPSYEFKSMEDAKKFKSYIVEKMNGDYPDIDVRPILSKIYSQEEYKNK